MISMICMNLHVWFYNITILIDIKFRGTQRTSNQQSGETVEGFNKYFQQKIQIIIDIFEAPEENQIGLNIWTVVTKLIRKSCNSFCELDPTPKWPIKDSLNVLNAPMTKIIQFSFGSGPFHNFMKSAKVLYILVMYQYHQAS